LAQARTQSEVADRQLADLKRLGEREALKSATGQLSAAKGKFMSSAAQLSYSGIRSPFDGVVTERPQYAGELAAANQPLLTLMDLSKLIAKAHISRAQAASLKVGDAAEARTAGSDDAVRGRVSLVSPALDPGSTTIEVWVELGKPHLQLKPGMTVQVSIVAKTVKDALVVPAQAVFKNSEGADYVMVAGSDAHSHLTTVQVGIRNGERVQIAGGLSASDQVIRSGGYGLPDKTQIKVQPASVSKETSEDKAGTSRDGANTEAPGKE
jgi:RND family efflux transporter MFP subunit